VLINNINTWIVNATCVAMNRNDIFLTYWKHFYFFWLFTVHCKSLHVLHAK